MYFKLANNLQLGQSKENMKKQVHNVDSRRIRSKTTYNNDEYEMAWLVVRPT